MWVVGVVVLFFFARFSGVARGATCIASVVGIAGVGIASVGVVECEHVFVAAAPVVFQLTVAPNLLELGFAGIFGGGVIEIPRIVVVDVELRGLLRGSRAHIGAEGAGLRQPLVAFGSFAFFFLAAVKFVDDFFHHFALFVGR